MFECTVFPNRMGLVIEHTDGDKQSQLLCLFSHHYTQRWTKENPVENQGVQYATIVTDSKEAPYRLLHHGEIKHDEIDWALKPFLEKWLGKDNVEIVNQAIRALNKGLGYVYEETAQATEVAVG